MQDVLDTYPQSRDITNHPKPYVHWSKEHEQIFVDWADKAMCYRWLHTRATTMYSKLNTWYTIPVIIISTLTGTANFAQDRIPSNYHSVYVMAVGGFNILAGIITTIQQFLKVTQLNEAHRVSSIAWDKFYRNVKIELTKHPDERMDVTQMIKICKEEFDRLIETSPIIPEKIISKFKSSFRKTKYYDTINKPEICDELISTNTFRNTWLNDENIKSREIETHKRQHKLKQEVYKKNIDTEQRINRFIVHFTTMNEREPLENEILEHMNNTLSIDELRSVLSPHDSNQQHTINITPASTVADDESSEDNV